MQSQHDASFVLARHRFFAISVHQRRQRHSVGTHRRFDNVRYIALIVDLIEVFQLFVGELLMLCEIEVAAVVHSFDFLEAECATEIECDIERRARVVRQLACGVLVKAQPLGRQPKRQVPVQAQLLPLFKPRHVRSRLDKELHLHLLELTRAKNEVAGSNLVAKCLADLRDAKGHFLTHRLLHVEKVHENTLRRFRSQIHHRRALFKRAHERLEHQVEVPRLGELTGVVLPRLLAGFLQAPCVLKFVSAEAPFARFAVD